MKEKLYTQEEFEQMKALKKDFEEVGDGSCFTVGTIQRRLMAGKKKAEQLFDDLQNAKAKYDNFPDYKNCVEEVKDKNGKVIKYHDVCRKSDGEMLLVGFGVNHSNKFKGLNAHNDFIGLGDWLDVYPDGELEVVGNVDFVADESR